MGHIAPDVVKRLITKGLITGIVLDKASKPEPCDACSYAKMTHKHILTECEGEQASDIGGEVHTDIWGPSPMKSLGNKSYYVSFTDDKTRYT